MQTMVVKKQIGVFVKVSSRSELHCVCTAFLGVFWKGIDCIINGLGGGERGIRTPGTLTSTVDFESTPFGLSGISPLCLVCFIRFYTLLFKKVS